MTENTSTIDGFLVSTRRSRGRKRVLKPSGWPARPNPQEIDHMIRQITGGRIWVSCSSPGDGMSRRMLFIDNSRGEMLQFWSTPKNVIKGTSAPPYSARKRSATRVSNSGLSKDEVLRVASECLTFSEFRVQHPREYSAAFRNGYLQEIAGVAPRTVGSKHYRFVYTISLGDRIYVGLSLNPHKRLTSHRVRGTKVVRQLIADGAVLTVVSSLLPRSMAAQMEAELICRFRSEGKIVLNAKGGGDLGGVAKLWDSVDKVKEEARRYSTRSGFCSGSNGAYVAALKMGIVDELFPSGRNGWRRTVEGKIKLANGVTKPLVTTNLATGEIRYWLMQALCREELVAHNLSSVLAGKVRTFVGVKNGIRRRYTARYLSPQEIDEIDWTPPLKKAA